MQAFTRSIFDLFSSKRRYLVPMFQRPYVWSQEKQWEPLWEDIRNKAIEHLERNEVDPHFLGAIVINQMRTFGAAIPAHEIIDGQQRLTTFQLFLAAFRDLAKEFGDEDVATELAGYTLNAGKKALPEEEFKVWPTRADQPCFSQAIKAENRKALESTHPAIFVRRRLQPRHPMVEAYLFFEAEIRGFLSEEGEARVEARIQALFSALQNSVQLVSIELETKDDPQIIFETLNARGVPLLSSDLLRNYVFLRAKREGLSAEQLYETYWQPFDVDPAEGGDSAKKFWKVEERQGRLVKPRLDLFFQHFLSLKMGRDINVGRLFHDYRGWIESEKPFSSVEEELQELQRYSLVFAKFFVPDVSTALGKFIHRLQRLLDTSTIFPFLLYLEADFRVEPGEKEQILRDLESFLVRRIVCGLTEKAYNKLFLQFVRNLREAGTPSAAIFRTHLMSLTGDSSFWPDDARFRDHWLRQPIYRTAKSAARIETMLRAIEEHHVNDKREQIRILGSLTIEHVMPQEWEKNWPLVNEVDQVSAVAERDTLIHTIGNLTLLTGKLNSTLSNASFSEKRPAIIQESALRLNTYFHEINAWNESEILRRGSHLFEIAKRIWPFPQGNFPLGPTSSVGIGASGSNWAQAMPPAMGHLETPHLTAEFRGPEAPSSGVHPHALRDELGTGSQIKIVNSLGSVQFDYWKEFVDYLSRFGSILQPSKPYPQNWLYLKLYRGGFRLEATAVAPPHPRISCGVTIQRPDARMALAALRERRDRIEAQYGSRLDWDSRNDRSQIECHIQDHRVGFSILNREEWTQQFQWLRDALERLQIAFQGVIPELSN